MILVTIKSGEKEKLIEFPETKEFSYLQYLELKHNANKAFTFLNERLKAGNLYTHIGQYLHYLAKALSDLTGSDLNDFYGIKQGESLEHMKRLSKGLKQRLDIDSLKDTLYGLFDIAVNQIEGWTPQLFYDGKGAFFEHEGVKYEIPSMMKDALTGGDINPELPTGKAIEVFEVGRIYNNKITELEEDDLQRVQLEYQRDIFTIAILARKEGESFPTSLTGIDSFINKRAKELENISMINGRNMLFFLNASSETLETIRKMRISMSHHNLKEGKTKAAKPSQTGKRKRSRKTKKSLKG